VQVPKHMKMLIVVFQNQGVNLVEVVIYLEMIYQKFLKDNSLSMFNYNRSAERIPRRIKVIHPTELALL